MKKILSFILLVSILMLSACAPATSGGGNGGISEADMTLRYSGGSYSINDKAAGLISALGDEYEFDQSESCAYDGYDKFYVYTLADGEVVVFTIPLLDGEDTICQVETSSPSFSTPKGITIGSSLDDVVAAYGNDYVVDASNYYYFAGEQSFTDSPHIYFTVENGVVTYMSIYSARNHG